MASSVILRRASRSGCLYSGLYRNGCPNLTTAPGCLQAWVKRSAGKPIVPSIATGIIVAPLRAARYATPSFPCVRLGLRVPSGATNTISPAFNTSWTCCTARRSTSRAAQELPPTTGGKSLRLDNDKPRFLPTGRCYAAPRATLQSDQ